MNNKTIMWVVGAVVVLGIVGWLALGRGPASGPAGQGSPSAAMTSLKSLLAAGTSQQCTFSDSMTVPNGGTYESSGVVYTSGGKMRGDFSSQVAGKTIASHMITDGTTSWVWSDAAPQGMKMSFAGMNQPQQGQTAPASANTNAIDPTKNINYKCGGWAADQSQFTIPANITFTDMSEMMKNMQGMMGGKGAAAGAGATTGGSAAGAGAGAGAGSMCAQCNQIPDATAKAQCLSALGCK